jgi:hypothetical protein
MILKLCQRLLNQLKRLRLRFIEMLCLIVEFYEEILLVEISKKKFKVKIQMINKRIQIIWRIKIFSQLLKRLEINLFKKDYQN